MLKFSFLRPGIASRGPPEGARGGSVVGDPDDEKRSDHYNRHSSSSSSQKLRQKSSPGSAQRHIKIANAAFSSEVRSCVIGRERARARPNLSLLVNRRTIRSSLFLLTSFFCFLLCWFRVAEYGQTVLLRIQSKSQN